MYRAVAYKCRREGVWTRWTSSRPRCSTARIDLPPAEGGDDVRVLLDGEEVGALLRTPEMGLLASRVSARPLVRRRRPCFSSRSRPAPLSPRAGHGHRGLPQAARKFYLDASARVRARRRAAQLRSRANRWMNSNCSPRSFGVIATTGNGPSRRWLQRTPCASIPPAFRRGGGRTHGRRIQTTPCAC